MSECFRRLIVSCKHRDPIETSGTYNITAQLIHLSLDTPGNLTPIELQGPFSISNPTSLPSASLSTKILSSVYLNHV